MTREYYDANKNHVSSTVHLKGEHSTTIRTWGPRVGPSVMTPSIVTNAIKLGHLPLDPNGVYFLLTDKNTYQRGFCTKFCGWHGFTQVGGKNIRYAWVGDASRWVSGAEWQ